MNDDIQKQLEALLCEVRLLSKSVIHLRRDDFRMVFGEQIKPILMERIDRFFGEGLKGSVGQEGTRSQLKDLVERFIADFQQNGEEAATRNLDDFGSAERSNLVDHDEKRQAFISELVGQMRDYLVASERISQQAAPPVPSGAVLERSVRPISPAAVEGTLGPLSNGHRIQVMLLLSKDDESLAALSKGLDMKKGHLQFHLDVLKKAEYISYDRKSHLYTLTAKGGRALAGISRLIDDLDAA
ncbi:MAG: winged helix-turn-helix domain-containing protein [Methanomassiliicoccales archaeon]